VRKKGGGKGKFCREPGSGKRPGKEKNIRKKHKRAGDRGEGFGKVNEIKKKTKGHRGKEETGRRQIAKEKVPFYSGLKRVVRCWGSKQKKDICVRQLKPGTEWVRKKRLRAGKRNTSKAEEWEARCQRERKS